MLGNQQQPPILPFCSPFFPFFYFETNSHSAAQNLLRHYSRRPENHISSSFSAFQVLGLITGRRHHAQLELGLYINARHCLLFLFIFSTFLNMQKWINCKNKCPSPRFNIYQDLKIFIYTTHSVLTQFIQFFKQYKDLLNNIQIKQQKQ